MDKSRIKVIMEQYDSIVQKEEEINIEIITKSTIIPPIATKLIASILPPIN